MRAKRDDIRGLRAWAVLAVLIFHFFPDLFHYGFLGVDVFFVLSGYLISLILDAKPISTATYCDFFFKRFRRIFPLAILVCLACMIFTETVQDEGSVEHLLISGIYASLFSHNLIPTDPQQGYFDKVKSANFFTHFWSLSAEIQFYLVAPLLLHVITKFLSSPLKKQSYLHVLSLLSLLYSLKSDAEQAYTSTLARLWQFLAGAIAFHLEQGVREKSEKSLEPSDLYGFLKNNVRFLVMPTALYLTGFFIAAQNMDAIVRLAVTGGVQILLVAAPTSQALLHPAMLTIGDASYALYLIHWPAICLLREFGIEIVQGKLLAMLACIALSILIHRTFEKWYLTLSFSATLALVGGLYACSAAAVLSCPYCEDMLPWVPVHASTPAQYRIIWDMDTTKTFGPKHTEELNAILEVQNNRAMRFTGCSQRDPVYPKGRGFCEFPRGNGNLHFLLVGNSYVVNLYNLILDNFKPHYDIAQSRMVAECSPIHPTAEYYCPDYRPAHAKIDADIDRERPDVLFVLHRYTDLNVPLSSNLTDDALFQFVMKRLAYFEERVSKKIIILQAIPSPVMMVSQENIRLHRPAIFNKITTDLQHDADAMRSRMVEVAKHCKKCVLFDVRNCLLDKHGNMTVKHPDTHLWYIDNVQHFTIVGKKAIERIFKKMSAELPRILSSHYPDNVISC